VNETEIPIIVSGKDVIKSRKVSVDWWHFIKKVRRVRKTLAEKYLPVEGIKDVKIQPSDRSIGGLKATGVGIDVDPEMKSEVSLPANRNGVDVFVNEATELRTAGVETDPDCWNTGNYSNMPGATLVYGAGSYGSACARAYDSSLGSNVMVTAAHLFDACSNGCSSVKGRRMDQNDQDAGKVARCNAVTDYVVVEPDSQTEVTYSNDIREDFTNGSPKRTPLNGQATNYEYMMSNSTIIYNMGVTTGRTTGTINSINGSAESTDSCIDMSGHGLDISCAAGDGDSGSPYYTLYDDGGTQKAALVGMFQLFAAVNASECNNNSIGPSSHGISSDYLANQNLEF